ncbi:hypothetical protein N7468_010032 [Penicillium chermesinum]|uniref:Uncharacterized protein n=1 Tax=Penicillium chermesinum TaxID=63820 RepID=A0A9W9TC53_9EURO|nr:uncharacterized protein N7468_010032 [Penicillium chermesinum]KAJ5217024.1 hypothetical protein N7468_010032 [Penicillium chermesinum]
MVPSILSASLDGSTRMGWYPSFAESDPIRKQEHPDSTCDGNPRALGISIQKDTCTLRVQMPRPGLPRRPPRSSLTRSSSAACLHVHASRRVCPAWIHGICFIEYRNTAPVWVGRVRHMRHLPSVFLTLFNVPGITSSTRHLGRFNLMSLKRQTRALPLLPGFQGCARANDSVHKVLFILHAA